MREDQSIKLNETSKMSQVIDIAELAHKKQQQNLENDSHPSQRRIKSVNKFTDSNPSGSNKYIRSNSALPPYNDKEDDSFGGGILNADVFMKKTKMVDDSSEECLGNGSNSDATSNADSNQNISVNMDDLEKPQIRIGMVKTSSKRSISKLDSHNANKSRDFEDSVSNHSRSSKKSKRSKKSRRSLNNSRLSGTSSQRDMIEIVEDSVPNNKNDKSGFDGISPISDRVTIDFTKNVGEKKNVNSAFEGVFSQKTATKTTKKGSNISVKFPVPENPFKSAFENPSSEEKGNTLKKGLDDPFGFSSGVDTVRNNTPIKTPGNDLWGAFGGISTPLDQSIEQNFESADHFSQQGDSQKGSLSNLPVNDLWADFGSNTDQTDPSIVPPGENQGSFKKRNSNNPIVVPSDNQQAILSFKKKNEDSFVKTSSMEKKTARKSILATGTVLQDVLEQSAPRADESQDQYQSVNGGENSDAPVFDLDAFDDNSMSMVTDALSDSSPRKVQQVSQQFTNVQLLQKDSEDQKTVLVQENLKIVVQDVSEPQNNSVSINQNSFSNPNLRTEQDSFQDETLDQVQEINPLLQGQQLVPVRSKKRRQSELNLVSDNEIQTFKPTTQGFEAFNNFGNSNLMESFNNTSHIEHVASPSSTNTPIISFPNYDSNSNPASLKGDSAKSLKPRPRVHPRTINELSEAEEDLSKNNSTVNISQKENDSAIISDLRKSNASSHTIKNSERSNSSINDGENDNRKTIKRNQANLMGGDPIQVKVSSNISNNRSLEVDHDVVGEVLHPEKAFSKEEDELDSMMMQELEISKSEVEIFDSQIQNTPLEKGGDMSHLKNFFF